MDQHAGDDMPATAPQPPTTADRTTPGRPAKSSGALASRNRRWLQMRDLLKMKISEIASIARKTRRTVQEGIRSARAQAARDEITTTPEGDENASQLTGQELGQLERQIRGNPIYQTPEVLEWMAARKADRRRAARHSRED